MDPSETMLPTLVQSLPFPSSCSATLFRSPPTSPASHSFDVPTNSLKFPSPSGKSLLHVSEILGIPRPLESLQSPPIPPFLSKTYEIVNDSSLDRVVSWSKAGQSFVVWDPVEFSRIVLPRHFKHGNFSSFVRQLNTYTLLRTAGFRKIDGDRWEFANEEFLRGKRFLLKNINRRRSSRAQPVGPYSDSSMEMDLLGTEDGLQKLKSEKYMLAQEVLKMKQEHLVTVEQMDKLNCRLQSAESKQKKMTSFWIKVLRNPVFLMQLKQTKKLREFASKRSIKRSLEQEQPSKSNVAESTTQKFVKYRQSFCEPDSACILQGLESSSETQLPDHLLPDMSDKLGLDVNVQDGSSNKPLEILEPSFNPNASLMGKNIMISKEDASLSLADFYISSPEEFSSNKMVMEPISPVSESFTQQDLQIGTFNGESAGEIQDDMACHTQYLASPVDDFSQEPMFLYSVKPRGVVACKEEFWDVDFEAGSSFTSAHDMWGNLVCTNPEVPREKIGLSAMWDFGLLTDEAFEIDKCFDSQFPLLQHMDEVMKMDLSDDLLKMSEP